MTLLANKQEFEEKLIISIKENIVDIKKLYNNFCEAEVDGIYRFYHQSFKVYNLQNHINEANNLFKKLEPGSGVNLWFYQIILDGTQKGFEMSDNQNWLIVIRPILEAFFHCKYFLEQLIFVESNYDKPQEGFISSEYASFLCLFNLR